MHILIDTHIYLWIMIDSNRISSSAKTLLKSPENRAYLSQVSLWETSIKYGLGKLNLGGKIPEEFYDSALQSGLQVLDLDTDLLNSYHRLPQTTHRDPFDRLLIWQAMNNGYTLLTSDANLRQYQPFGLRLIVNE